MLLKVLQAAIFQCYSVFFFPRRSLTVSRGLISFCSVRIWILNCALLIFDEHYYHRGGDGDIVIAICYNVTGSWMCPLRFWATTKNPIPSDSFLFFNDKNKKYINTIGSWLGFIRCACMDEKHRRHVLTCKIFSRIDRNICIYIYERVANKWISVGIEWRQNDIFWPWLNTATDTAVHTYYNDKNIILLIFHITFNMVWHGVPLGKILL